MRRLVFLFFIICFVAIIFWWIYNIWIHNYIYFFRNFFSTSTCRRVSWFRLWPTGLMTSSAVTSHSTPPIAPGNIDIGRSDLTELRPTHLLCSPPLSPLHPPHLASDVSDKRDSRTKRLRQTRARFWPWLHELHRVTDSVFRNQRKNDTKLTVSHFRQLYWNDCFKWRNSNTSAFVVPCYHCYHLVTDRSRRRFALTLVCFGGGLATAFRTSTKLLYVEPG